MKGMSLNKSLSYYLSVAFVLLLVSCGGKNSFQAVEGDVVAMRYSSLLEITDCDGYTVVDVADPWSDNKLVRYLLVPSDSVLPQDLPDGVLLRTPLERALLFSGVHAGLFGELGVSGAIKGVCDARYFYSKTVADGLADGTIADCGSSLNVDAESVVQLSPDAVFVLPFENGGFGKLENLGYPLVVCADYMENSPLGCAEWMRFYGRLFGKPAMADSIFSAVSAEYETLRGLAASVASHPRLMCELKSNSAWYVPCGESTMGRMYADAGANYIFSSCKGSGSVPLSYEVVLDKAADADVWLLKYNSPTDKTYASLLSDFAGYSHFAPYKERNIYACNTHRKHLFEETAFHPERLLRELISIFHPELLPGYTIRYYEKM